MLCRRPLSTPAGAFLTLALLLDVAPAAAQRPGGSETERRLAEQLLELEEAIASLLEGLDPRTRSRVEALAARLRAERLVASETAQRPAPAQPPSETPAAQRTTASRGSTETSATPPPSPAVSGPSTPPTTDPPWAEVRQSAADVLVPDPPCQPLLGFDTNQDGALSGGDRLWRHFYLATGGAQDDGFVSLFEVDVRSVALDVSSFGTKGDSEGYVLRGDRYRFELIGRVSRRVPSGLLAVDADGLARNGSARLLDENGDPLGGMQVLESGQRFAFEDGSEFPVGCP